MYTIKIEYQTGDSFHTEDTEDIVGHVWNNIDQAKIALSYIKEHYGLANGQNNEKPFIKEHKGKPWLDNEYPFYCLLVPNDDGELVKISCFWMGYFEHLYGASIVIDDDSMGFRTGY